MHESVTPVRAVGFIGTGTLTAAAVRGIRAGGTLPAIHLSPRSEVLSAALSLELPNVFREESNSDVVSKADLVVLAIRPQQLEAALSGLSFRPEQVVVSFVATVPCCEIARLVAPASQVCRVTPLPTIASGRGPIVVSPPIPQVEALFGGIGDVIRAQTEAQMMAFGAAAGLLSTFFELEDSAAGWLVARGIPAQSASLYVRSMFSALGQAGLENRTSTLSGLAVEYETAGGLNESARRSLRQAGFFALLGQALTDLTSLSLANRHD